MCRPSTTLNTASSARSISSGTLFEFAKRILVFAGAGNETVSPVLVATVLISLVSAANSKVR